MFVFVKKEDYGYSKPLFYCYNERDVKVVKQIISHSYDNYAFEVFEVPSWDTVPKNE